jgi:hypothetical protein
MQQAQFKVLFILPAKIFLSNRKTQDITWKIIPDPALATQPTPQADNADNPGRPSRLSSNTLPECYIDQNLNRHHTPCRNNMYSRKESWRV